MFSNAGCHPCDERSHPWLMYKTYKTRGGQPICSRSFASPWLLAGMRLVSRRAPVPLRKPNCPSTRTKRAVRFRSLIDQQPCGSRETRFALNRPLQGFQQHSQNHDPYGEGQEYNHNVTRIKDLVLKLIDDEQEGAYTCCVVGGSVRPKREASRVR